MSLRSFGFLSLIAVLSSACLAQVKGPSSSAKPYYLPSAPGGKTVSILTVGDQVNGPQNSVYRMVGIPDGMGVMANGHGTFELLMNHELGATAGVIRAHGQTGAFVSSWKIQSNNLKVIKGQDFIESAVITSGGPAFGRFCSSDLAVPSAYAVPFLNLGTTQRLYLTGEEAGAEGRAFATVASGPNAGIAYELPAFGNMSYENSLASPTPNPRTVVVSLDDSTPGQVYVYIGAKKSSGNEVERAGLTGGTLYGVKIAGQTLEDRMAGIPNGRFNLQPLGDVSGLSGADLQTMSTATGVTEFLRPEDGAWDPRNPNDFYFVTTDRFNTPTSPGRSRLYRLRFDSVYMPELGGRIEQMLDGTEGQQMMDNMCIDGRGNVVIQEDPGNQSYLAKIWNYDIATDTLKAVASASPEFFLPGPSFLTQDEESSGIIDASDMLGRGWFLFDAQAHYPIPGELVEGGQILALFNPYAR